MKVQCKSNECHSKCFTRLCENQSGQCSLAKYLWQKLENIYLKKHVSQDRDNDDYHDSNREDNHIKESNDDEDQEAKVGMDKELISALSDLRKIEKKIHILEQEVSLLRLQVEEV